MIIQNAKELEVHQVDYATASSVGRMLGMHAQEPVRFSDLRPLTSDLCFQHVSFSAFQLLFG